MRRLFGFALLAAAITAANGCAMCESCFDYNYPAYGGSGRYQAECNCRAGSAFCGHGYAAYESSEETPQTPASPDAATPQRTPGDTAPTLPTTPITPQQPVDLTPRGTDPANDLELPPLPGTPSSTEPGDGVIPDPADSGTNGLRPVRPLRPQ